MPQVMDTVVPAPEPPKETTTKGQRWQPRRAEKGTTMEQDPSRAEMSADRQISFRKSPAKQRSAPLATCRHQPRVLGDLALHEAAELHVPCCRSQIVTRCSSSPRARIG